MERTPDDVDVVFLELLGGTKWFAVVGMLGLMTTFVF